MELEERRRADELDRYWDAVMRGESPDRPVAVDDVAVGVIARLGEHRALPGLDMARYRVRRQILAPGPIVGKEAASIPPRPGTVFDADDRAGPRQPIERSELARPSWLPIAVAIAAVLLLAVGLGYYVLGLGRSENGHRNTIPAAVAPATPIPPTPTPAATEETIVDVVIPADYLPTGGAGASLAHFTIPAGAQTTWTVFQNVLLHYIW